MPINLRKLRVLVWGFPDGSVRKKFPCQCGRHGNAEIFPGSGRSLEEEITPVFLPENPHGQRSVVATDLKGHRVDRAHVLDYVLRELYTMYLKHFHPLFYLSTYHTLLPNSDFGRFYKHILILAL